MKLLRNIVSILGLVGLLTAPAAFAQNATRTPFTQTQYYASDFANWAIRGQSANTYLFSPGGLCNATADGIAFYVFNTNAPVAIIDATPANSEIVTPATVTNTGSQCGFTASPANNHYSFQVISGTAGLQEAINALSISPTLYPALIVLDRNFFTIAASLPGGKTGGSIVGAVTGSYGIILEDVSTAPAKYFGWNGTQYVSVAAPAAFAPNSKVVSNTVLAVPTAVSTSAATYGILTTGTTGGTVPASSTYRMALTYVDASGGETLISVDTASTATIATGSGSTNTLSVTSPAAETGAVGYRVYLTAASGAAASEILYTPTCVASQLQTALPGVCAIGFPATISAIVTGTATIPALNTAYQRVPAVASFSYPPFTALGTVASTATGTLATLNFPAGYFNTLGRTLAFCGNGYATNNNTTGTVALNMVFASVPGVTSITPFTASYTTATTTAVQVPLDFCVTVTTAATGATGTLEVHGWVTARTAASGAGVAAATSVDNIFAVSSTVDLTKQDQVQFTITPTTTGLTAAQIRQLTIVPSN
jgi:hypothetical protein